VARYVVHELGENGPSLMHVPLPIVRLRHHAWVTLQVQVDDTEILS